MRQPHGPSELGKMPHLSEAKRPVIRYLIYFLQLDKGQKLSEVLSNDRALSDYTGSSRRQG
jgi:hypothetical protein